MSKPIFWRNKNSDSPIWHEGFEYDRQQGLVGIHRREYMPEFVDWWPEEAVEIKERSRK